MATATLFAICLSALVGHSLAFPSQALISPGAVGRQAITDFQNNRHGVPYLPRAIHRPYFYPALAPVPFALSLIDLPSELSADAPRSELFGVKAQEKVLSRKRRFRRQAGTAASANAVLSAHALQASANAGLGGEVWRSDNGQHSVSLCYPSCHPFNGNRASSSPTVGVRYKFSF